MPIKRSEIIRIALEKFSKEIRTGENARQYERVKSLLGVLKSGISDLGQAHREHLVKRIKKNANM